MDLVALNFGNCKPREQQGSNHVGPRRIRPILTNLIQLIHKKRKVQ